MINTTKVAQNKVTREVFNPDMPDCRPTAKGDRRIPKRDEFMPDWSIQDMELYQKGLKDGKEDLIVSACIKRKEGETISRISTDLRRPYETVRGWLVRGRERGLYNLADRKSTGRPPILNGDISETVRDCLSKSPLGFGFNRKLWQCNMIQKIIHEKFSVYACDDAVRRLMRHIRYSYHKLRPCPHKSAPKEEQEAFKSDTAALLKNLADSHYTTLAFDGASCMIGGQNGYGWLPVGGHDTIPMSWAKKSVRLIGVLGDGWFCIAMVDKANSDTIKEFLETMHEKVGNMAIIMDNASTHKSNTMDEYENASDGAIRRIFLPKYTPQLNPIEILWRELKRALAGRYFNSIDELKAAIMNIVNNGELLPPKLMDYMLPDCTGQHTQSMPCTIMDMTSTSCTDTIAA